jgi:intraflagellar transport protein 52
MCVVGSCQMFGDQYLDKEHNERLLDVLLQWMTGQLNLNAIDAETPDISDYHYLPDSASLADTLRVCMQDSEQVRQHTCTRAYFHYSFIAVFVLTLSPSCS